MHREELSCQRGSVGGWAGEISRILLIAVLEFLFHAGSGWGGNNRMNDSENAAGCSIRTHVPVPTSVFSNISWKLKASGNLLSYNFLIFWTLTLLTGLWHLTQGLNHDSPHMPVAPHPPHEIPAASVTGCGGGWEREVVCGLLLLALLLSVYAQFAFSPPRHLHGKLRLWHNFHRITHLKQTSGSQGGVARNSSHVTNILTGDLLCAGTIIGINETKKLPP